MFTDSTSINSTANNFVDPISANFERHFDQISTHSSEQFKVIQRFYLKFHAYFISLLFFELLAFGFIFHYFPKSSVLAVFISAIFLTIFSRFVLLSYFQVRKPQQFNQLKEDFLNNCKKIISFEKGSIDFQFSLSFALRHLISKLKLSEAEIPAWFRKSELLSQLYFKWRIWTQWKDLLTMKEQLFSASIEEHFTLIKLEPTDLEAHASLATVYRTFSKLYIEPQKLTLNEQNNWMPSRYFTDEMEAKSKKLLERALQELIILNDFAPHDPWVYAQLASLYEELKMIDKEIEQYEKILEISPEEKEVLLRLGICYFQQGHNAKGLRIYQRLKTIAPHQANDLLNYYDAYK